MRPSAKHLIVAMALILAACSSAPTSKSAAQPTAKAAKATKPVPPPRVEMQQDEGGFSIVEDSKRRGNSLTAGKRDLYNWSFVRVAADEPCVTGG